MKDIIAEEYLKEFAISDKNIYNKFSKYINKDIKIEKMFTLDRTENIDVFVVNCKTRISNEEFIIIIKVDYSNNAFAIYPFEYTQEDASKMTKGEIQKNNYNEYKYVEVSDIEMAKSIFEDYKNDLCYYTEDAYNKLDLEYAEKKFGNKSEFRKFVDDNKERIENSSLRNYKIEILDEFTQYICLDEENNYYIFKETSPMQYTVILDTYTLDLPEFLERYNSATPQEKVALNIQKFMQAIDSEDYNYAYNCLSDGFKKNYFNTVEEFKKYVKENFYSKNIVTYKEFEQEGNLYKYEVNIDNASYIEEIKTKTFIVKLNEGTDFEMSFNID